MYLKVQYNNSIKNYNLTDNYNKPYIKVSNSILPLTTNTTNGICIKIQANNTTYRPLEYQSMSTSDTYYTSAVNSNGLSSTTALTRSSTYDTQYYTRSSTSSTVYYTRSSTSGTNYLTGSVSHNWEYIETYRVLYTDNNNYTYSATTSLTAQKHYSYSSWTGEQRSPNNVTVRYTYTSYQITFESITSCRTIPGETKTYIYTTRTMRLLPQVRIANNTTYTEYGQYTSTRFSIRYIFDNNITYISQSTHMVVSGISLFTRTIYEGCGTFDFRNSIASTTGTQYLTRSSTSATSYLTRSSTYSTVYLTRSSTSGYSGVSSSSSQSSGWL